MYNIKECIHLCFILQSACLRRLHGPQENCKHKAGEGFLNTFSQHLILFPLYIFSGVRARCRLWFEGPRPPCPEETAGQDVKQEDCQGVHWWYNSQGTGQRIQNSQRLFTCKERCWQNPQVYYQNGGQNWNPLQKWPVQCRGVESGRVFQTEVSFCINDSCEFLHSGFYIWQTILGPLCWRMQGTSTGTCKTSSHRQIQGSDWYYIWNIQRSDIDGPFIHWRW